MNDPSALSCNQPPSPPTLAGAGAHDTELIALQGIDWLLLDIEGTTCPVSFVAATLFPYASENLADFLEESAKRPDVQSLLQEVIVAWEADPDPAAAALLRWRQAGGGALEALPYLQWLILEDRKLAPLKELQGLVWEQGYVRGDLLAPLYSDVHGALERWQASGLSLAVYSSGSVAAQQMLYAHTNAGDLRHQFSHWFDTRVGGKKETDSYTKIARELCCQPGRILFISDSLAELEAADAAGMLVLFSHRDGNPEHDPGPFKVIRSYAQLKLIP